MMTKKIQSFVFIKIGLYVFLLVALIYVMRYSRSQEFSKNVDVFLGNPSIIQELKWCPNQVQILVFISKDKYTADSQDINELCRLTTKSYKAEEVVGIDWKSLLLAKDSLGHEQILESDKTMTYLRFNHLIYKNEEIKEKLMKVYSSK